MEKLKLQEGVEHVLSQQVLAEPVAVMLGWCGGSLAKAPVHRKGDSLIDFRFFPCFDSEMLY